MAFLKIIKTIFVYIPLFTLICACSMGTSFKSYQVKSFKGVSIPELSKEPILIENLSIDLIEFEKQKKPLNLPLGLLNYNPSSYKVGPGDKLFIFAITSGSFTLSV